MRGVGRIKRLLTTRKPGILLTGVHHRWRQEGDPGVVVAMVVPIKKHPEEPHRVLRATEALRERRVVFDRPKMSLHLRGLRMLK